MKVCTKCGTKKANASFSKDRQKADGLRYWCKECDNQHQGSKYTKSSTEAKARAAQWYKDNPERVRERRLQKTYGISIAEYDKMLEYQEGRCAICRNRPKTRRLAVDHNHKTGEVRGLLCDWCNRKVLGGAREKPEILEQAAQYLREPPARQVLDTNDKVDT